MIWNVSENSFLSVAISALWEIGSDEGDVVCQIEWIWSKYIVKWEVQTAGMNFQIWF